ncbi:hypothetical protein D3C80_1731410 [compost metagenome]
MGIACRHVSQLLRRDRRPGFARRVLHHHRNIYGIQYGKDVLLDRLRTGLQEKWRQQHQRIRAQLLIMTSAFNGDFTAVIGD